MLTLWLVVLATIAAFAYILHRKRRPGHVRNRTEEHEALLAMLREIVAVPEIADAMIRHGGVTRHGLAKTVANAGYMSEKVLRAVLAQLFADRTVRRLVAQHIEKQHGAERKAVMRGLGELMEAKC